MSVLAFLGAAWWALLLALVFAGIAVVAVIMAVDEENHKVGCISAPLAGIVVFAIVFGILAAISSYTTVQRGTVGLVSRFGALTGTVFQPGLHWKTPFIETVEVFDTTQQSYEMSDFPDESLAQWTDFTVGSQTSDGQSVKISATTIFRVPDGDAAVSIRQNIGIMDEVVENVVKANVRSIARNTSKLYTAAQLYSGDITEYQDDVGDQLADEFDDTGEGLILVDFKVRGIAFEEKYSDAVEAKQIAAERIVTEENNAKAAVFEAQRTQELAKGEAQANVERAKGQAEATRVEAEANAYAIEQEGAALKRFNEVLTLRFIENLNDKTLFLPSDAMQYLLPLEDVLQP